MIWFIGSEPPLAIKILAIKIPKKMLTQQKFNKILRIQNLIFPKQ